jgi:hypothetical protein
VLLDTTPPATVSDALPSYAGSASIHLTALDNEGGSGVVATYWRLDSGPWTTGPIPPVTAPGTHVLQFYSVDAAGNAEQPKTVMFAVS